MSTDGNDGRSPPLDDISMFRGMALLRSSPPIYFLLLVLLLISSSSSESHSSPPFTRFSFIVGVGPSFILHLHILADFLYSVIFFSSSSSLSFPTNVPGAKATGLLFDASRLAISRTSDDFFHLHLIFYAN